MCLIISLDNGYTCVVVYIHNRQDQLQVLVLLDLILLSLCSLSRFMLAAEKSSGCSSLVDM